MRILKGTSWLYGIIIFIVITSCIFIAIVRSPHYLSKTNRVASDVLVVEGWISEEAIMQAYDEFIAGHYKLLITTGGPMPDDFEMLNDGKLVFNFVQAPENINTVKVKAYEDHAGEVPARFEIAVNDSVIGSSYATPVLSQYEFNFLRPISEVRKVEVIFDNDYYVSPAEDRNLYVHSIVVGDKEIMARNDTAYFCQVNDSNNLETVAYSSQAFNIAATFKKLGIRDSQIITAPSPKVKMYRTKNNARALLEVMTRQNLQIKNFNLFSEGIHSRRSLIIYKHMFGREYNIGIVAAHEWRYSHKYWWFSISNMKHLLRELAGNFYFRFF